MNYRLIRNVKVKGRFAALGVPLFFIVALFLFHFSFPTLLGALASRIALPFWSAGRFITNEAHSLLYFFSSKNTLAKDVERLTSELENAHRLLTDRDLLAEENRLLKEAAGRTQRQAPRVIGALLATPPRSPYDTAVIDVGTTEGVTVGNPVLSGSTRLGVVSKAYTRTSLIEFYSAAGRKTPVSILHAGIAIRGSSGEGGGAFKATIPKKSRLIRETVLSYQDSILSRLLPLRR